jgi:hypothetical protein
MRIFMRSSHSDCRKSAATAASSGEQSGQLAQAEKKLADRRYASTSDRREMVTVAMRDGFAKAPRSEDETSGLSPGPYCSGFASLPWRFSALPRRLFPRSTALLRGRQCLGDCEPDARCAEEWGAKGGSPNCGLPSTSGFGTVLGGTTAGSCLADPTPRIAHGSVVPKAAVSQFTPSLHRRVRVKVGGIRGRSARLPGRRP